MIVIKSAIRIGLVLLLLVGGLSFSAQAQEVDPSEIFDKSNQRNWRLAMEAKRSGNAYLALSYLEKIYQADTARLEVILELAPLYRITHNYPKTAKYYQKIIDSKKKDKYPEAYFYLGQAQKNLGKHDDAEKSLLLFKKKLSNLDDADLKKLYKAELEGCAYVRSTSIDSSLLQIRNLGVHINQPHIDFSPIPLGDNRLIFGSYPETKERVYELDEEGNVETNKRQFFTANRSSGEWKKEGVLNGPFNDPEADIANGCFSLDSNRFFFAKCQISWQNKMVCAIYMATKQGEGWSEPEILPEEVNLPDFTSTHPTMGRESRKNNEVLYFASDREGSKGGMDIWFSEFDARKGEFKKARNAGSKINTVGEEVTPFYDLPSKTLYFSTNGSANIGGLDIYSAIGETSKWEVAVNMGPEINSTADDLDFALKPSNRGGYFVSNRIGGQSLYHATCCDDIYEFEYSKFIEILDDIFITNLNNIPLEGKSELNLYVVDSTGKLMIQTRRLEGSSTLFELRPGKQYKLEVKKEGYFPASVDIDTRDIFTSTRMKDTLRLEEQPKEPIIISNIRYDFDSPNLTSASKNILDTTLLLIFKKYPTIQFEISAHTDSKGTDEYNMRLSQKRAESVVKYLNSKGVPLNQMVPKGYGETKPIAPNTNEDGSDNPEGREKNRRTEFKILGEIEQEIIDIDDYDEN